MAGVTVELAAPAFLQLNRGVAAAAYAAIREAVTSEPLAHQPRARIVDVYSGVGAIAFSLADLAPEIVAIEENAAATAAGAAAAAGAGQAYAHVRFVTAEATAGLAALDGGADVIVLNPPRGGASAAVIAAILRLEPRLIVYLSCNPATLARDLLLLTAPATGFAVTKVQPFDMLPHTAHVETFAALSRDPQMTTKAMKR
jgi:23S rRNA (uracil1939-C5)-methyltransferase